MFYAKSKIQVVTKEGALPGRDMPLQIDANHFISDRALKGPYPTGAEIVYFGLGCFWGAERRFWSFDGVWCTAVGYGDGHTPNATYEEVCTGLTGHNELVMVVYEPAKISLEVLLGVFFEAHDPTQGMRQGNDIGTQYRSGIYVCTEEQLNAAMSGKQRYQVALKDQGLGAITTEIKKLSDFYYAETYHQQYLAKNPGGYCGLKGTNVGYCPASV